MAAPYVSGAAALAIAASGGTLTNAQVGCRFIVLKMNKFETSLIRRASLAGPGSQVAALPPGLFAAAADAQHPVSPSSPVIDVPAHTGCPVPLGLLPPRQSSLTNPLTLHPHPPTDWPQVAQYLAASSRPAPALRGKVVSGGIVNLEQLLKLVLAAKARADAAKKLALAAKARADAAKKQAAPAAKTA